jgi:hypothetical protein
VPRVKYPNSEGHIMGTSAFGARSTPEAAPSHFRGVMLGTRSFMIEVACPNQSKSHEINVIEALKDLGSLSRFENP